MEDYGPLAILAWVMAAIGLASALIFVLAWMEATLPSAVHSQEQAVGASGETGPVRAPEVIVGGTAQESTSSQKNRPGVVASVRPLGSPIMVLGHERLATH